MTASATVDLAALKSRHPLGDTVEAAGWSFPEGAGSDRASAPSMPRARGASRSTETRSVSTASAAAPAVTCLDFVQRVEGVGLPGAIRKLQSGGGLSVRSDEGLRATADRWVRS